MEASAVARAVVANSTRHLTILVLGKHEPIPDDVDEQVRSAILEALERDWPDYIAGVLAHHARRY